MLTYLTFFSLMMWRLSRTLIAYSFKVVLSVAARTYILSENLAAIEYVNNTHSSNDKYKYRAVTAFAQSPAKVKILDPFLHYSCDGVSVSIYFSLYPYCRASLLP